MSEMDEQTFLQFVYCYVRENPGVAVALQAYAREAIEEALRNARAQIADTEAAFVLHLGRSKPKPAAIEKLRKWDGRTALNWRKYFEKPQSPKPTAG